MTESEPTELIKPGPAHADLVASWSTSVAEAQRWCSIGEHPFDPGHIRAWWREPDVQPWLLLVDGRPVAYGEVWVDEDEGEFEIARVIIEPAWRGQGVGRRFVTLLAALGRPLGLGDCFVRVAPDNAPALAAYRGAGFVDVDPALAAEWNVLQPTQYVWLRYSGG